MTAQNLYSETVSTLSASEQLTLASLILNGLAKSVESLDYQDHWSDEDLRDVVESSLAQTRDEE